MSSAFGMGFWIDEEGVFMSCPAFEFGVVINMSYDMMFIHFANTPA